MFCIVYSTVCKAMYTTLFSTVKTIVLCTIYKGHARVGSSVFKSDQPVAWTFSPFYSTVYSLVYRTVYSRLYSLVFSTV